MSRRGSGGAKRSDARRVLRLLGQFGRPHRRWFIFALILLAIEASAAVFEAYPLAYLVDFLSGRRPGILPDRNGTLAVLSGGVVLLTSCNSLADSLAEVCLARAGRRLGLDLRIGLYRHLTKLSMAFHDRRRTGDTLTRLTGDVTAVEDFVVKSFSDLAGSVFVLLGTVAFLATHSIPVTLVALVIVPALAAVSTWFSRRIKEAAKRHRAREGDLASDAQEMLTSIRVIQSFGRGHRQEREFIEHSQLAMEAAIDSARIEAGFSWVVSVLQALSTVAVVWVGVYLIDRRQLTVGTLLLFVILIQNMFKPTRRIIKEWNSVAKVFASVERIGDLIDRQPAVVDRPDAVEAPQFTGTVEFRDVSFAYGMDGASQASPAPPTLDRVSFRISSGQMVALVGPSGAGKSTIAQLVPRLYDPVAGQVLVDGVDVRSVTLASLRRQLSMVLQEAILFTGTVADNIAFGADKVDLATIRAAAVRANAHEFIEQLPDGYQTVLGERASNLSGGQRQRISIARAFLRDSPILILDEPTSGLDSGSVDSVLQALLALVAGKTTLLITHDMSLTQVADRILVVEGGRIVEDGTHSELIAAGGLYFSLCTRQSAFEIARAAHAEGDDAVELADSPIADPLASPVLNNELPGLAHALDNQAMQPLLAALLKPGYRLVSVTAGKARYQRGQGCTLRYELDIVDDLSGVHLIGNVGARVCLDGRSAAAFYEQRVLPIAQRPNGGDELRIYMRPAMLLTDHHVVLYAHPIDPDLPTLFHVVEPRVVAALVERAVGETAGELSGGSPRVELVRYPRHNRCILRYRLPRPGGPDEELYVKVFSPSIVLPSAQAVVELAALGRSGRLEPFAVPSLLWMDRTLHLTVLESMPGEPIVTPLVRAVTASLQHDGLAETALDHTLATCARIAANIHHSGIQVPNERTWAEDRQGLHTDLAELEWLDPDLGCHLRNRFALIDQLGPTPSPRMVLSHGDFTPSQVLFHDEGAVLLDFDTLAMSEPALDLGRFSAHLRMAVRKGNLGSLAVEQALIRSFVDAYIAVTPGDQTLLRQRIELYELLSLGRIALHAWRHLKGARLRLAVGAFDDLVEAHEEILT
jgi:ABC-type multidrug transport system fused ATPase/permease subunit